MNRLFALALGGLMIATAGFAGADDKDDNAKKIVGKWEITKSGSELPVGTTVEFTKDGKLMAVIKEDGTKIEGTYKVEKDKMTVKIKAEGNQTHEEQVSILKLTDAALEVKDKDGKVDVFKKAK